MSAPEEGPTNPTCPTSDRVGLVPPHEWARRAQLQGSGTIVHKAAQAVGMLQLLWSHPRVFDRVAYVRWQRKLQLTLAGKPAMDCPNCGRIAEHGLFSHTIQPEGENTVEVTVTHCGCFHEPKGGERYTAVTKF